MAGGRLALKEARKDLEALWAQLTRFHKAGWLMGAGSPSGSDTNTSDLGIVQGHAYALLAVRQEDGHQLVRLRNPWGKVEWSGDWSDESPLWTGRMKSRLGWSHVDDGTFWMSLDDFTTHFARLYVCKLPSESWHRPRLQPPPRTLSWPSPLGPPALTPTPSLLPARSVGQARAARRV